MRDVKFNGPVIRLFISIGVMLNVANTFGATLTEDMDIACRQPAPLSLECAYRMLDGREVLSASAIYESASIPGAVQPLPDNAKSVILFLVDTSDPARETVVRHDGQSLCLCFCQCCICYD